MLCAFVPATSVRVDFWKKHNDHLLHLQLQYLSWMMTAYFLQDTNENQPKRWKNTMWHHVTPCVHSWAMLSGSARILIQYIMLNYSKHAQAKQPILIHFADRILTSWVERTTEYHNISPFFGHPIHPHPTPDIFQSWCQVWNRASIFSIPHPSTSNFCLSSAVLLGIWGKLRRQARRPSPTWLGRPTVAGGLSGVGSGCTSFLGTAAFPHCFLNSCLK